MTTYVAFVGSGLMLIEADDEAHARHHVARCYGCEHKPWLLKDLNIRPVEPDELEAFKAQGAKVVKAKAPKDWQKETVK